MDTTRRDHLGCYGYGRPTSPNLDAFAEESVLFESCYSTNNDTLPNHSSILTGLYPYNHGVLGSEHRPLHPDVVTLGDVLLAHGYNTVAITSVAFMNENTIGNGFQRFHAPDQAEKQAEGTTDLVLSVLDQLGSSDQSFFLWVHYFDPHYPYYPPGKHRDAISAEGISEDRLKFVTKDYTMPGSITREELADPEKLSAKLNLTERDRMAMVSAYDAEIAYMDYHIGRLMGVLKSNRLYDNSIVIVTADHGESLFENDADWLGHWFIYEPVVRIPLMIRNSDMGPKRVGGFVQNIDIAPTVLNWLGLEAPYMDGKVLDPLILGGQPVRDHVLLAEEARIVGTVTEKYKVRMVTSRQAEPLPPPQAWIDDVQKLPRIGFDPQPPSEWDYDETRGVIFYRWKCPPECSDRIDKLAREAVSEGMAGPDHAGTIAEIDPETTETIAPLLVGKRVWDKHSFFRPALMRIVARDKAGKNIASSDIVQFALDSPLGIEKELFDLANDPNETHNLADEKPEVCKSLESRLSDFGKKLLSTVENGPGILGGRGGPQRKMSKEDIERLRALGYIH
jgi:arylsulfatase A-like enzyme